MTVLAATRLPFARLLRTRRGLVTFAWWTIFALGAVLIARHANAASADLALLAVFVPFVLPLVAYALVGAVVGGEGLGLSVRPLLRFGASPLLMSLAAGLVAVAACTVTCTITALLLLVAAHNALDPPLAHDVLLTAYAAALGAAAHGGFFVLGASIGRRGWGRSLALLVNWLVGTAPGWVSGLVPYAHTRALLGGAPLLSLTESGSAWCLGVITTASLLLAALFSARR